MAAYTSHDVVRAHLNAAANVDDLPSAMRLMGSNIAQFISAMPVHAHYRSVLLNIITKHVPTALAALICNTSESSVIKSKHASLDELHAAHGSSDAKRQYLTDVEHAAIVKYIHLRCGPVSGGADSKGYQFGSTTHLYQQYRNDMSYIIYDIIGKLCSDDRHRLPDAAATALTSHFYSIYERTPSTKSHVVDAAPWVAAVNDDYITNNIYELIYHRRRYYILIKHAVKRIITSVNNYPFMARLWASCDDYKYLPLWMRCNTIHARNMHTFFNIRRTIIDLHHHQSTKSQFDCMICWYYKHARNGDDVMKGEGHVKLLRLQRCTYHEHQVMASSDTTRCVIVFDWTSFTTSPNIAAQIKDKQSGDIKALVVCMYRGKQWYYHNFLIRRVHAKHQLYNTQCIAMRKLMDQSMHDKTSPIYGVTHMDVWSDGAGGQFKNKYWLSYLIASPSWWYHNNTNDNVPTRNTWSANYFAPYHGHSICDATAGHIKEQVRLEVEHQAASRYSGVPDATIDVIYHIIYHIYITIHHVIIA
jgi:hypothetical protein